MDQPTNHHNKLKFRGLLTESIAKELLALYATQEGYAAPLRVLMVKLMDSRGQVLASMPLAEAIHATAFDVARSAKASWGNASIAEVYLADD